MKLQHFYSLALVAAVLLGFTSCNNDDEGEEPGLGYDVPETYNFSNASYSGQTARMDMLDELTTYMKTSNTEGVTVSADTMDAMYANDVSGVDYFSYSSKDLQSKTDVEGEAFISAWIDSLAAVSVAAGNNAGSNGTAGRLTTAGSKTYLFSATGIEYTQFVEKGLMGACFYYQATSVYLADDEGGIGADNTTIVTDKDYTQRQHHWDEAFGYFGAPIDLNSTNVGTSSDDRNHAKYSQKAVDAGWNVLDPVMESFIEGRAAIDNNDDTNMSEERDDIRQNWEYVVAGAALHYLNGAKGDDFTDVASRCHQLSEAYAFIWSLNFNSAKTISVSEVTEILGYLGDNFYTISQADIISARDRLAEIYGVSDSVKDAI